MKKALIVAGIVVAVAVVAWAQTWHPTNQATVGWDAVTTMTNEDGTVEPLPEGDTITYKAHVIREANIGNPDAAILLGETSDTQYVITLPDEGRWFVGVSAVRIHPVEGEEPIVTESEISWSSVAEVTNNDPFGFAMFYMPTQPSGLRPVE